MQLEFFDVPSPCVGICQADDKGHCLGCMRSRDERQQWQDFSNDEKQKVIKRCIQRRKRQQNKLNVKVVESNTELLSENIIQPSLLEPVSKTKPSANTDLDFSDFDL